MKLSDHISPKKSLLLLGLYLIIAVTAAFQVYDTMYPIKDAQLAATVNRYMNELSKNPNDAELHLKLGWTYHQIASDEQLSRFFGKAEKEYQKALSIDASHIQTHYSLGLLYEEIGESKKAWDQYQTILQLDPKNTLAIYSLGVLAYKDGQLRQAIDYYKKAIELEPLAGNLYYELGKIFEESKDPQQAIVMYRKAIDLLGNNTDASQRIQTLTGK